MAKAIGEPAGFEGASPTWIGDPSLRGKSDPAIALRNAGSEKGVRDQPRWGSTAVRILISSGLLALSISVSLALEQPEEHVATLWLGVGLQLGILLIVPKRQWAAYVAAFFVTSAVVLWYFESAPVMVLGAALSNCLEALVAALVLARDPEWTAGRSDRLGAWAKFALIAVILLPAVAAAGGTLLLDAMSHIEANRALVEETWTAWYVGDALGVAVLTPMILRLQPHQFSELRARGRLAEGAVLVVAFGAFTVTVFLHGGILALFLILPPLIIVLYRIGFVGLAAGMGVFVPVALGFTLAGRGPFVTMADGNVSNAILLCQVFSMLAFGVVVLVAALLDERQRLHQQTIQSHGILRRDLEAAAMIQTALLPQTMTIGSITCSGLFLPSSVVAGDTYNVLTRTDGKLAFFQLDVSGHGAAAALVSVAAHNALSQAALAHASGKALDEVVDDINRDWPGNLPYFTLIFGELDPLTGQGGFVQAGHPSPLLIGRQGAATLLGGSGFPIGLIATTVHDVVAFTLAAGDRLLMYSDGLVEAEDQSGKAFSVERLCALVEDVKTASSQMLLSAIERELRAWCGSASLLDDVSVLLIERKGTLNEAE
jgi:serine phosphatase RsbU (regulator of sigma subunit)